jgi:hypothetical protein
MVILIGSNIETLPYQYPYKNRKYHRGNETHLFIVDKNFSTKTMLCKGLFENIFYWSFMHSEFKIYNWFSCYYCNNTALKKIHRCYHIRQIRSTEKIL